MPHLQPLAFLSIPYAKAAVNNLALANCDSTKREQVYLGSLKPFVDEIDPITQKARGYNVCRDAKSTRGVPNPNKGKARPKAIIDKWLATKSKYFRPIESVCPRTGLSIEYANVAEAVRQTGADQRAISRAIKRGIRTTNMFWKYADAPLATTEKAIWHIGKDDDGNVVFAGAIEELRASGYKNTKVAKSKLRNTQYAGLWWSIIK